MTNHLWLSNVTVHFNHLITKETGQSPYSNTKSQGTGMALPFVRKNVNI